jgi:hypothetical protein
MTWAPAVGRYEAHTDGRVRNRETGYVLSISPHNRGYASYQLKMDGKNKCFLGHRLVAMAHLPNPDGLPCVDHVDGDTLNNDVSNLRWCTYSQNGFAARYRPGALSQYRGVVPRPKSTANPYAARITRRIDGKQRSIWLGSFPTEREAAAAYNAYASREYGEFARLNVLA